MSKLLCVYCASSDRLDAKYLNLASELGTRLVAEGWDLVFGGGKTGAQNRDQRSKDRDRGKTNHRRDR